MDYIKKNIPGCIYISVIFVLMLVLSSGQSLWYDESFSWNIIHKSYGDIIRYTALDVHPPLYYFILKFFTGIFGDSLFALHLVSIVPYVFMLGITGVFVKERFGEMAGFVTTLLFLCTPAAIVSAVEARMYSWAILMVVSGFILAIRLAEKTPEIISERFHHEWILFSLVNAAAAYLHYFAGAIAILVSLFLILYLMIRSADKLTVFKNWCIANLITFVLYLPWLSVFFSQLNGVKKDYWIEGFHISDIKGYLKVLFGDDRVFFYIMMCVAAVSLYLSIKCFYYHVKTPCRKWNII